VGNKEINWQNYNHELASYKNAIRRAKRTAWQTFCSDIEKTTDAARLRKILSKTAPLGYLQIRSPPIRQQLEMIHSKFQTIQIAGTGQDRHTSNKQDK